MLLQEFKGYEGISRLFSYELDLLAYDNPDISFSQIVGPVSYTHLDVYKRQGFARGTRIEMEFDEEQFSGAGAYLFASVLERFFGLYVSMNSFSQLVARSRQRKEPLEEWPPRAGQSVLI